MEAVCHHEYGAGSIAHQPEPLGRGNEGSPIRLIGGLPTGKGQNTSCIPVFFFNVVAERSIRDDAPNI